MGGSKERKSMALQVAKKYEVKDFCHITEKYNVRGGQTYGDGNRGVEITIKGYGEDENEKIFYDFIKFADSFGIDCYDDGCPAQYDFAFYGVVIFDEEFLPDIKMAWKAFKKHIRETKCIREDKEAINLYHTSTETEDEEPATYLSNANCDEIIIDSTATSYIQRPKSNMRTTTIHDAPRPDNEIEKVEPKWNKARILHLLKTNNEMVKRSLLVIYGRQTAEEQNCKDTIETNGVGFSGSDAGILTSIAQWYLERGYMSPKQLDIVRKKMLKYTRQLVEIANQKGVEQIET
jgi:hypothetical protein